MRDLMNLIGKIWEDCDAELEEKASDGVSKKEKSKIEKKAHAGKKVFGGHFKDVEKKAEKEYGNKKEAEAVAGAAMWKKARGK